MKKLILPALLAVIFSCVTKAQTETTYFNANWQKTSKDSAAYYRPVPKAKEAGYWIQDFYISGALQMEGLSASNTEDIFVGEMTWYHENGKLMQKAIYVDGVQEGELINYDTLGIEISRGITKEGAPFSGSFYEDGVSYYSVKFYENGVVKKYSSIANTESSKARVDAFYKDGAIAEAWFYGQSGELIGKSKVNEDEVITDGVIVSYYFNPMLIESVQHVKDNKYIGPTTCYYTDGKVKFHRFYNENKEITKEVYYDKKGSRTDSITFKDYKPYSGILYLYHPTHNGVAAYGNNPSQITSFKDGLMDGSDKEFYPNGTLKSSATYALGIADTRTTYDSTGRAIYTMQYQEGLPYAGTFIDTDNSVKTYKEGLLTEETRFYPNGKVMLTKNVAEGTTVYDENGKVLSKLEYKNGLPWNGRIVELSDGLITYEETYKDGEKASEVYFNGDKPSEKLVYSGNQKLRTQYYANGKPKQETRYINDNEREITCYDINGKRLGSLQINDLYELSGTKYVFDYDSIAEITEYVNNKIIRSRKFFNNALLYDKNYNGKATFYDPFEKKMYSCSFREGIPITGTEVEYDDYNKTIKRISNYLNGKLHGSQIQANYNYDTNKSEISHKENFVDGVKNGLEQEFYNENLLKEVLYKNGFKEGEAKFYNKEGKIIATGLYKDDNPWNGKFIDYTYDYEVYSEASYTEGKLEGASNSYTDGILAQSNLYTDGILVKTIAYQNGEPKYTLIYKNGEPFEGISKSYDEFSFYKNGVLKEHQRIDLSTGEIKSIEIFEGNNSTLTAYYANGKVKSVQHLVDYSKQGKAIFYGTDGKILGEGEYIDDMPVSGKFVFYHSEDQDARVEMIINTADFTAIEIVDNRPARRLKYELLTGKDEDIAAARSKFARMLTDIFEGYNISVSY